MTAVLIVDDHASMRETLWDTLQRLGDFQLAGSIGNANLAKLFCERMHPDLVLMDVCTENGASGLAATEAIKADMPEIRVIIMTSFDEISYAPRAKAAGADAFVYKSNSLSFSLRSSKRFWPADIIIRSRAGFRFSRGKRR